LYVALTRLYTRRRREELGELKKKKQGGRRGAALGAPVGGKGKRPNRAQQRLNRKVSFAKKKNKVYRTRDFKVSVWG
jgi:hypothetical protein